MKKSLTRKLTIAVIALVFAVVSLSTSTYAWFTMSNEAQVDPFTAEVKAGEGIEIAVTSGSEVGNAQWYTGSIPGTVVEAAYAGSFEKFDALTTTDGTKFYDIKDAAIDGNSQQVELGAGYVSFYVHIKSAQAGTIYLSDIVLDSKSGGNEPTAWTADAAYKLDGTKNVAVGDKVLYEVENAARVYVKDKIYEKEALAATGENGNYEANNAVGTKNENGSFSYYNSKDANDLVITNAPARNDVAKIGNFEASSLGTVSVGDTLTFQVNVWIEGWDAECLNAIFAQTLSVQLNFEIRAQ